MKVCVVGAGAIGGLFGAWLARAAARPGAPPLELSVLARGPTLAALRQHGLRLREPAGQTSYRVRAEGEARALGEQDLVILAVKAPALPGLADALAVLTGTASPGSPGGTLLSAMNGVPWWFGAGLPAAPRLDLARVDPGARLAVAVPARQVLGCVVHLSSRSPEPGLVEPVRGDELIVGPAAGPAAAPAATDAVLARLSAAGFVVRTSACIQRDLWFKLWGNLTMNPVSALTGATCDRILDDPLARGFCSAVMVEAEAIGSALGLSIGQAPEERHAVTRGLGAFKTSMLVDLEAGRALELDAIVGVVHDLGRTLGIATPNVDALFGLARLLAQQRGLYPAPGPGAAGLRS